MYLIKTVLWSRRRLILGVVILGFIAYLIISPNASEAFMALWLGGVVPGTRIVVPPDVMMWGTVLLLIGSFTISIIRHRIRTRHKRANHQIRIPVIEAITEPVLYLPENDMPVVEAAQATPKRPAMKRRHTAGMVRRKISLAAHGFYVRVVRPYSLLITRGMSMVAKAAFRFLWALLRLIRSVLVLAVSFVVMTSLVVGRSGRALWQWALPYLRQFDTWLEVRYRKAERSLNSKLNSYEVVRTSRHIARDYIKSAADIRSKLKQQVPKK